MPQQATVTQLQPTWRLMCVMTACCRMELEGSSPLDRWSLCAANQEHQCC